MRGSVTEHVLERAARVLRALAAQRQVRQLEQHAGSGDEPGGLLERDQRLADAAEPRLQHLGQLAQRGGGQPLVALGLGHAGALLERRGQARHVGAAALQRAQLAERGQVVGLDLEHLGQRAGGELEVEREVARRDGEPAVVARPLLGRPRRARPAP